MEKLMKFKDLKPGNKFIFRELIEDECTLVFRKLSTPIFKLNYEPTSLNEIPGMKINLPALEPVNAIKEKDGTLVIVDSDTAVLWLITD
jgi:hypothetical protein